MSALERYQSIRRWLDLPTYNSVEEAERNITLEDSSDYRHFLIRGQLGCYHVCRIYLERGTNVAHQIDFTISTSSLNYWRRRAQLEAGIALID